MDKRRKTIKKTVAPMRVVDSAPPAGTDEQRHARIAARAYARFVARGCVHGYAMEDWLAAEAEI